MAIADLDRPGLSVALRARGIRAEPGDLARPAARRGLVLGWRGMPPRIDRLAGWPGPVMLVLAEQSEAALIATLDAGADDAVPDTASDALIAARLVAMLRRGGSIPIEIGSLRIDPLDRHVTRADIEIRLLPREYRLLMVLARQPGQVVDRATLLQQVCGIGFDPGTNVLDVHVSRLRAKLDRGFAAPMLLTEKGRGFRLVAA